MALGEKEILEKINDPNVGWFDKMIAITAAGEQGMIQFEERFVEMMFAEKNFMVCEALAKALVNMDGEDDAVLRTSFGLMLDDENSATKYGGVVGLKMMKDPSQFAVKLFRLMDSENEDVRVRSEAAAVLAALKDGVDKELLQHEFERILENQKTPEILKKNISKTLEKLKNNSEPKVIKSSSSDKNIREIFQIRKERPQMKSDKLTNSRKF